MSCMSSAKTISSLVVAVGGWEIIVKEGPTYLGVINSIWLGRVKRMRKGSRTEIHP